VKGKSDRSLRTIHNTGSRGEQQGAACKAVLNKREMEQDYSPEAAAILDQELTESRSAERFFDRAETLAVFRFAGRSVACAV
jgi:hypothetical protein